MTEGMHGRCWSWGEAYCRGGHAGFAVGRTDASVRTWTTRATRESERGLLRNASAPQRFASSSILSESERLKL